MKCVRIVSRIIILQENTQVFYHHLLKRLSSLNSTSFAPLSKISQLYLCRSIFGHSVLFHLSICFFFHKYHTILITLASWYVFNRIMSVLQLSPFPSIFCWLLLRHFSCVWVSKSHCNPENCNPARLLSSWDSPGKNIGVGCCAFLQGIEPVSLYIFCICRQLFFTTSATWEVHCVGYSGSI